MKPGRELDARIAEAMGWKCDPERGIADSGEGYRIIPYFSVSMNEAMKVWEWLNKDDNAPYITVLREYKGKPTVVGSVESIIDDDFGSYNIKLLIQGETYPHAICLAALAIKESNKL